MGELYYIVYSEKLRKIYWFMRKEKADKANLLAMRRYINTSKSPLIGNEIYLSQHNATKIKALLAIDAMWAALELIEKENPNAIPIEYPDSPVFYKS
jgi:hypothetical protein